MKDKNRHENKSKNDSGGLRAVVKYGYGRNEKIVEINSRELKSQRTLSDKIKKDLE